MWQLNFGKSFVAIFKFELVNSANEQMHFNVIEDNVKN